jgi:hypothetical protein
LPHAGWGPSGRWFESSRPDYVAAFVLIGVVAGVIVLFAVLGLGGWSFIRLIGANEND